jgi:hypothetical protein
MACVTATRGRVILASGETMCNCQARGRWQSRNINWYYPLLKKVRAAARSAGRTARIVIFLIAAAARSPHNEAPRMRRKRTRPNCLYETRL